MQSRAFQARGKAEHSAIENPSNQLRIATRLREGILGHGTATLMQHLQPLKLLVPRQMPLPHGITFPNGSSRLKSRVKIELTVGFKVVSVFNKEI